MIGERGAYGEEGRLYQYRKSQMFNYAELNLTFFFFF